MPSFVTLPIGDKCPTTTIDLDRKSKKMNCTEEFGTARYHCLRNEKGQLGTLCVEPSWIQKEYCPEYNEVAKRMDAEKCNKTLGVCPGKTFLSSDVISYSACIYSKEPTYNATTSPPDFQPVSTLTSQSTSTTNTHVLPIAIWSSLPLAAFVVIAAVFIVFYLKKKGKQCRTASLEKGSEDVKTIETFALLSPIEEESSVIHARLEREEPGPELKNFTEHVQYYESFGSEKAIKNLFFDGWIILKGLTGSGKTTMGLNILSLYHNHGLKNRTCRTRVIKTVNELSRLEIDNMATYILLVDDVCERWEYMPDVVDQDLRELKCFYERALNEKHDARHVFAIFTLSNRIWELYSDKFTHHVVINNDHVVDLHKRPYRLGRDEILILLQSKECYQMLDHDEQYLGTKAKEHYSSFMKQDQTKYLADENLRSENKRTEHNSNKLKYDDQPKQKADVDTEAKITEYYPTELKLDQSYQVAEEDVKTEANLTDHHPSELKLDQSRQLAEKDVNTETNIITEHNPSELNLDRPKQIIEEDGNSEANITEHHNNDLKPDHPTQAAEEDVNTEANITEHHYTVLKGNRPKQIAEEGKTTEANITEHRPTQLKVDRPKETAEEGVHSEANTTEHLSSKLCLEQPKQLTNEDSKMEDKIPEHSTPTLKLHQSKQLADNVPYTGDNTKDNKYPKIEHTHLEQLAEAIYEQSEVGAHVLIELYGCSEFIRNHAKRFFEFPETGFMSMLTEMLNSDRQQYRALVYLMLKGGRVALNEDEDKDLLEHLDNIGFVGEKGECITDMRKTGLVRDSSDSHVSFRHELIYIYIFRHFTTENKLSNLIRGISKRRQAIFIEHCDPTMLLKFVTTENSSDRGVNKFVVIANSINTLARRLAKYHAESDDDTMNHHVLMRDVKFKKEFQNELAKKSKIRM